MTQLALQERLGRVLGRVPGLAGWLRPSTRAVFEQIHRANAWGDDESASGHGSNLEQTRTLRSALPGVLRQMGVTSILDVPCGDFHWMRHVDLEGIDYTGADIVDALVEANRALETPSRRFVQIDLTRDPLPRADLVLVRDCLVHLSYRDARRALGNLVRSGSTWLATTTFSGRGGNTDIETGGWRPLDLCAPPFELPEPRVLLPEQHPEPEYSDKALGMWRLEDLPF